MWLVQVGHRREGRRWRGALGTLIGLVALAASCTTPATEEASPNGATSPVETLRVHVWGGAWGDAVKASVGDAFEQEFGVKVEYVHGGSSEALARMRSEAGNPTLDVVYWTPQAAVAIAAETGELVPLQEVRDQIPNIGELHPGMFDAETWGEHSVVPWTYAWTMMYRTDLISEEEAAQGDSWSIVLDPKWKGKVGFPDINSGQGMALMTLALIQGQGTIESGDPRNVDEAWELVPQLADNVVFYQTDEQAVNQLRSGEVWMQYRTTFELPLYLEEGLPVAVWTDFKEGLIATFEVMSIVKSGDPAREELAAKFVNMQLSQSSQEILATHFFTPSNRLAQIPAEVEGLVLTVEEVEKLQHFDYLWMAEQHDQWTEEWNRLIAG